MAKKAKKAQKAKPTKRTRSQRGIRSKVQDLRDPLMRHWRRKDFVSWWKQGEDCGPEDNDPEGVNPIGSWVDDAKIIRKNKYVIWYMNRDGFIFSEEKDNSTLSEDLEREWHEEYDLTPEELAQVKETPYENSMQAWWETHPYEGGGEGKDKFETEKGGKGAKDGASVPKD